MNSLTRYIILSFYILSFTGSTVSFSQLSEPQPRFHNYTVDDGLPASETYFVHQDKKGYIWICTDRGVSRFDGHTFQNFTTSDGLTDNVVFRIEEDYKGRIWFVTYNSELCYFENEKIKPYKYNGKIKQILKNLKTISHKNIYIDKKDNLYLSVTTNGLWIIDKNGHAKKTFTGKDIVIKKVEDRNLWIIDDTRQYSISPLQMDITYNSLRKTQKINSTQRSRYSLAKIGHCDYLLADKILYSLKNLQPIKIIENAISLNGIGNTAWIGTVKNGVICVPDLSKPGKQFNYLNGFSVSSVMRDKQGGYWFSTLEKGVFYSPSLDIKSYTMQQGLIDNNITGIAGIKDNIYIGYLLGRWQNLKYPVFREENKSKLTSSGILGASSHNFYISYHGTDHLKYGKSKQILIDWSSDYFRKENSVICCGYQIYKCFDNGKIDTLYDPRRDVHTNNFSVFQTVMQDAQNTIWGGTVNGLVYIDHKKISAKGLNDPLFKVRVSDLGCSPEWKNIVATRGEGIYFFEDKKVIRQITAKDGLLSDLINVIYIDAKNGIWAGSNKGLNHIVRNKNGTVSIESFTTLNGLISNEISAIYVFNEIIYVATKGGLSLIDTKNFRRNANSDLYLTSFEAGEKELDPLIYNVLDHDESQITIRFRNTNYRILDKKQYEYRFSKTSEWVATSDPEISLFNPNPDDYNLEIRYLNEDGMWSDPKSICRFTIDKAFYNKWYFFVGIAILLGLIAWRLFRIRIRQLKQRHILNDKISQLEQKALQAQMNPHFIFNALNSIQSFLVYEENDKAEKYLLKFATLIRQTLNNSREQYITLESEISTLEKYLDLERMRFKNKFTYHIQNDLVETEMPLKIPNMLIQPFVENAVIHGFSTLDSGGKILIRFESVDGNQILCTVEDNGVGRKKTMEQSAKKHIPHGVTITEERLRAFQSKHGVSFKIETIDLENPDGTKGTRVIINLPVINVS